jgi:ubiquinone/menaquinone biosynthesis C-methylase UbiE
MKNIYLIIIFLITIINLKAQNMSIFIKATQSGWYPEFLNPVVESVLENPQIKQVLDIGTGPGTLPQMLINKDTGLHIIGIDISRTMIDEARKSVSHKNVSFEYQESNKPLPFENEKFDAVTFCSVLFLVDDGIKANLINEAFRVLKPNGKIIVLTPSGKKPIMSSFIEVWKYRFSLNNFTFPIWKIATSFQGRKWGKQEWLKNYAKENEIKLESYPTFNNNATIEIIYKSKNN